MNLAFRAAVLGQQHAAEVADRLARILLGRRRLGRMLAAVAGSQRQPEQDRVEQRTQGGGHSCLLEKTRIASASGTTTQPASTVTSSQVARPDQLGRATGREKRRQY